MELNLMTDIKFNVTQKAKDFLQKAGKTELYVEAVDIQQCCIPLVVPPTVRKGRPYKPEKFDVFDIEGITIYYDRNLIRKPEVTIDAQGIGFAKGLKVSNWEIKY